ncbi:Threonylcarbamoyl-AMP synthase [Methyloligella halotolerans]|uniref:Threonylcarbamoyl-AMP synthase n=1 Tax=Methyloligella halotolerans TaxID=1177755 RepID=A0A1E2RZ28_9HYPH|nr:L-threonylcarbamoyladenylate synthase [Methyloligella halotolerans]ODA67309.1 Threonylcarbamoyl-AMP synthase [Methyloligella halotolerans]
MKIVARSENDFSRAALALAAGELVAFPTETVYGLGANALDSAAVAGIFAAKSRPRFNPLIVHVHDFGAATEYAAFSTLAEELADAFWPGPLTLVLPRLENCPLSPLVSSGLDTVALRSPAHKVARRLLETAQLPIAAPSANRSGRISPTSAADVHAELGDVPAIILDGGRCPIGLESTVIRVTEDGPQILRSGALPREEIEEVLGRKLSSFGGIEGAPLSPGQLASHYAPDSAIRLGATDPKPGEAFLTFGPDAPPFDGPTFNLSESGDLQEAAANFFHALRALDETAAGSIAVMPIPFEGLGEAINDRLQRAAAER